MSFTLTRPPSPSSRDNPTHPGTEEDSLSSALHAALQNFTSSSPHSVPTDHDMANMKEKEKSRLEIIVNSDCLQLKGTGVDVEPAILSGYIALYLTESTSIREITLQFRGKARLPAPAAEPTALNNSPLTYIICNHEWSFLEGEKRHSHTLKAGRHLFPFRLQVGGSLPSSICTSVFGGASIVYKLRAAAVRPGLSHNLQAMTPVFIVRSFASEALEYQQTLEIENTWPEKLMYSIMIPHKAWAAGDKLTALVKFSPLAKGARVLNVTTTINETTKLHIRTGYQEHTRSVASAKHEIVGGKAVPVEEHHHRYRIPLFQNHGIGHGHHSPVSHSVPTTPGIVAPHHLLPQSTSYLDAGHMTPYSTSPSHESLLASVPEVGPSSTPPSAGSSDPDIPEGLESQDDVITQLTVTVPLTATPSHTLEPIVVSHRIRWSILISNLDGHTSELRCSLPMHLLDYRLIDDARSSTLATRRLLLGGPDVPSESQDDMELPSYPAHVRDRVANMFLPETATMRVTNPWVQNGVSPTLHPPRLYYPMSSGPSGASSPLEAHPITSSLPHTPGSGINTPLDWVNSELLLSLSDNAVPHVGQERPSPPESTPASHAGSRPGSGLPSRRQSRASSPERQGAGGPPTGASPVLGLNDTFVHGGSQASRNLHGIFHASMKPFTSITHHGWLSSRSNSHSNIPTLSSITSDHQRQQQQQHYHHSSNRGVTTPPSHDPYSSSELLHRAFTEVPDYGIASRGFIGGVPPLTSMRGLPSYEEAERSSSETDLAARFAQAHQVPQPPSLLSTPSS